MASLGTHGRGQRTLGLVSFLSNLKALLFLVCMIEPRPEWFDPPGSEELRPAPPRHAYSGRRETHITILDLRCILEFIYT